MKRYNFNGGHFEIFSALSKSRVLAVKDATNAFISIFQIFGLFTAQKINFVIVADFFFVML